MTGGSGSTDRFGSVSDSRVSDLAAGKLTPNLSDRIADVRGRQCPTRSERRNFDKSVTQKMPKTDALRLNGIDSPLRYGKFNLLVIHS